jgi:hypothetical protein
VRLNNTLCPVLSGWSCPTLSPAWSLEKPSPIKRGVLNESVCFGYRRTTHVPGPGRVLRVVRARVAGVSTHLGSDAAVEGCFTPANSP